MREFEGMREQQEKEKFKVYDSQVFTIEYGKCVQCALHVELLTLSIQIQNLYDYVCPFFESQVRN